MQMIAPEPIRPPEDMTYEETAEDRCTDILLKDGSVLRVFGTSQDLVTHVTNNFQIGLPFVSVICLVPDQTDPTGFVRGKGTATYIAIDAIALISADHDLPQPRKNFGEPGKVVPLGMATWDDLKRMATARMSEAPLPGEQKPEYIGDLDDDDEEKLN